MDETVEWPTTAPPPPPAYRTFHSPHHHTIHLLHHTFCYQYTRARGTHWPHHRTTPLPFGTHHGHTRTAAHATAYTLHTTHTLHTRTRRYKALPPQLQYLYGSFTTYHCRDYVAISLLPYTLQHNLPRSPPYLARLPVLCHLSFRCPPPACFATCYYCMPCA